MSKSLSKNSIYYLCYNFVNVLFPFLSGIYLARVLLPDRIGKVSFVQNIVQYFVILSFLGIPTYALKEIPKVRNDKNKLSKLFSELFYINLFSTIFFLTCYYLFVFFCCKQSEIYRLYIIFGGLIAINSINISWLYEALEEFGFISLRNILYKTIFFVLLVLIIKNPDDYFKYAIVYVIGVLGNNIINILYFNKFCSISFSFSELHIKKHLRNIFLLVFVNIAIEIYMLSDITMLGYFSTDENVAFYSYGSKISKTLLVVINTFTLVVVPRLSLLYAKGCFDDFYSIISKTLRVITLFSIPTVMGILICSDSLICLIYGEAFRASSIVLKIISITLIITPIGYLLGSRVLLISSKEKLIFLSVSLCSTINVIGNLILIPIYNEKGAALSSVLSETVLLILYLILNKGHISRLSNVNSSLTKIVLCSLVMMIITYAISFTPNLSTVVLVILQILFGVTTYFGLLYIIKERTLFDIISSLTTLLGSFQCKKN